MNANSPLRTRSATIAALLCLGLGLAAAGTPPQVATCSACHGGNGMGNPLANFPPLAGQPAHYLEQQLTAFKAGTRQSSIMQGMAASLSASEAKAIADYYAALPVPPAPEPSPAPTGLGATIALDGLNPGTPKAVPACAACHGAGGLGQGEAFPRIAGLPAGYIERQFSAWKTGTRHETTLHLMRNIADKLDSTQIDAVASYYAALSPNPSVAKAAPSAAKSGSQG